MFLFTLQLQLSEENKIISCLGFVCKASNVYLLGSTSIFPLLGFYIPNGTISQNSQSFLEVQKSPGKAFPNFPLFPTLFICKSVTSLPPKVNTNPTSSCLLALQCMFSTVVLLNHSIKLAQNCVTSLQRQFYRDLLHIIISSAPSGHALTHNPWA